MIASLASLSYLVMTALGLRGGLRGPRRDEVDWEGRVLLGLFALAAALLFGPLYGISITLAVMIHEYGHVAAYRVIGHHDARFRMLPLVGGVAISDRLPDTEEESFFVSLMGPAICIAPMVAAFALHHLLLTSSSLAWTVIDLFGRGGWDLAVDACWTFGTVMGAMNALNLLPAWPLDGGRCLRNVANAFNRGLARHLTMAMVGAVILAALLLQSLGLLFFALIGAQSAMHDGGDFGQRRMARGRAALAFAAWAAVLATHLLGGWPLIERIAGRIL